MLTKEQFFSPTIKDTFKAIGFVQCEVRRHN